MAAAILLDAGDVHPDDPAHLAEASPAKAFYATPFDRVPTHDRLAALGRAIFFDAGLSASGKLSCASCHDPNYAYGPSDAASTARGGLYGSTPGLRAVPSLRYLQSVPVFTEHMREAEGDDSADLGPAGGRTWDGRAQSVHDQARLPLLAANEMANLTPEAVVNKLRAAKYARQLEEAFGDALFDHSERAFNAALLALEVFQQTPEEFFPYDSKYDEYLRGRVELTEQERRGLTLFNEPAKGNCASCHPSAIKNGAFPLFSDFGFVALGVPRNRSIPANKNPRFFDLGLCGPERRDLVARGEYCGMFRTPSLRNVAQRHAFFHNGGMHTLDRVLDFYAERDTAPEKWYAPRPPRNEYVFDDLPRKYAANINTDPPFGRRPGEAPALTRAERTDIAAFLGTLNDGFRIATSIVLKPGAKAEKSEK